MRFDAAVFALLLARTSGICSSLFFDDPGPFVFPAFLALKQPVPERSKASSPILLAPRLLVLPVTWSDAVTGISRTATSNEAGRYFFANSFLANTRYDK